MKTPFVLAISFLLLAFAGKPLLGEPLFDNNGDEVQRALKYYVVGTQRGGGLSPSRHRDGLCPLDVTQEPSATDNGIPLIFETYNKTRIIYEAVDLNVKFSQDNPCTQSLVWRVDNYDGERGNWFITTGATEGNPGAETLLNWFKFERIGKNPDTYKIVYCPSVCASCVYCCKNVGVSVEDRVRSLVLKKDDEPVFPFIIIPAEGSAKCA